MDDSERYERLFAGQESESGEAPPGYDRPVGSTTDDQRLHREV
jgi:hypothetical protein